MHFSLAIVGVLHVFDMLQNAMHVLSARLDTDSIGPANLEVTYGSSVELSDVQEPVEDVVIVLGVYDDLVCAIEDTCGFGVYEAAGAKERGVCRDNAGGVTAKDETFLQRIGIPIARGPLGVIIFGFS